MRRGSAAPGLRGRVRARGRRAGRRRGLPDEHRHRPSLPRRCVARRGRADARRSSRRWRSSALPLLVGVDLLAGRASRRLKGTLRADLTAHLLALGPAWTGRERSGELAGVIGGGVDALEAYITSYQPARALAVAVPLLVLVAVVLIDPPTALVLLFTGPVLVLLLAIIGGRARAITDRRFAEIRYLGAFFLDMLRGLPTLKMFGRGPEQVANIRDISRRYGDTTMDVLRTAFQTSLVLEWGAAVAVALVAVEVSLRLMDGSIEFERALAVLIIVPEFFLPLRTLAIALSLGRGRADGRRAGLRGPRRARRRTGVGGAARGARFGHRGPGRRPRSVRRRSPSRIRAERRPPSTGSTWSSRTAASSRSSGRPAPARRPLANLLLRFIEPDAGVDPSSAGSRSASIDLAAWRSHVAWVPQRPYLFHGTVADNIRLARPDASDEEIRDAAREAGADDVHRRAARAATTRRSGRTGSGSAAGSASASPSPGRSSPARGWSSSTRRPRTWTRPAKTSSAMPSARMARDRAVLVVSHRLRLVVGRRHRRRRSIAGGSSRSGAPADLAARDGPFRRLLAADAADARRVTTFGRLLGLTAGQRRWIAVGALLGLPGRRVERRADGGVGLPHLEGGARLERRRGRPGDHRGPGPRDRRGRRSATSNGP